MDDDLEREVRTSTESDNVLFRVKDNCKRVVFALIDRRFQDGMAVLL